VIDFVRTALIYIHILLFAFSISLVLWADYTMFFGSYGTKVITKISSVIKNLLIGLWISGLLVIYIDTGFSPSLIAANTKLVVKLLVVLLLTFNGMLLHYLALEVLLFDGYLDKKSSRLLAISGSISTSHWLLAAFVGVARPLKKFPISDLLIAYVGLCACIVIVALTLNGWIQNILNQQRAERKLVSMGLRGQEV
jgi:hypothetical protein